MPTPTLVDDSAVAHPLGPRPRNPWPPRDILHVGPDREGGCLWCIPLAADSRACRWSHLRLFDLFITGQRPYSFDHPRAALSPCTCRFTAALGRAVHRADPAQPPERGD